MIPWSSNPSRRAAEKLYLAYTLVWGAMCAAVTMGGFSKRWGDGPLLAFGLGLWITLVTAGLVLRAPEDRGKPFYRLFQVKLSLFMAIFAFLTNWFGSRYFYEVLDMHYGFRTSLFWNDVPAFLYPLTAVYFTTYAVLFDLGVRAATRRGLPRVAANFGLGLLLALLETTLNASPWARGTFYYGSQTLALSFGTFMYGSQLMIAGSL